jgi:hypothetical protein
MRANRAILGVAVAVFFLLAATLSAQETLPPVGTVTVEYSQVSAGVGVSWGSGVLKFQGKDYPFKINGLQIAAVGISKVTAVGEVYRLSNPSDFYGKWAAAEAGLALGGGPAGLTMKNQKGVVMNLRASQQGVQLNLAVEGLNIEPR